MPFAHPLAVARQTEQWPDVVAVCGSGIALVDPQAFTQKYNNKCEDFCKAAGEVINEPTMFAVTGLGYGEIGNCRGDKADSYKGAVCECSMQDRL